MEMVVTRYLVATGNVVSMYLSKYVVHCFLSEEIKISREPTHIGTYK